MANQVTFTKTLAAASANNIATSQSPGAGAITLVTVPVVIDTYNAATNSEAGRRVIVTSGGNDTGINFTVTGLNSNGQPISDTFAGVSGAAAQSNLDFTSVSAVTHTGSVASTVTVGTNGVGSCRWITWSWMSDSPMNLGYAVELVSGSATFSVEHTYDDPNNLPPGVTYPLAFPSQGINNSTATADGSYTTPVIATRLSIATGTGTLRARFTQAGVG